MRINSELMDAQLENKASDVTPATTAKGLIYYKSTTEPIKVSDGTTVHKVLTDQMAQAVADLVEGLVQVNQSQVTPNYALAASDSGTFTTSSTSYVDVTNQSVSLITTGNPVLITLIGKTIGCSAIGADSKKATFQVLRDASVVGEIEIDNLTFSTASVQIPAGSLQWLDAPSAGTYTYKLQMKTAGASASGFATNIKLLARNL